MSKIVLITGASSGFGRLMAEALAKAGHTVYGSMRQTKTRNAAVVEQMAAFSRENRADLRALELDVTSIIVPGAFTSGTNHFAHSGRPADSARAGEYEAGPYQGFGEQVQKAFAAIVPPDADAGLVAEAVVDVVGAPFGTRPFRVHIDPTQDGADVGFAVLDRVRAEMLHRVGLSDLLKPKVLV